MCIAIIEVTYRSDAPTDAPRQIRIEPTEYSNDGAINTACAALQSNEFVVAFRVFRSVTKYMRREIWDQVE